MNEWNKLYESVPPLDTPVWAGWFNADGSFTSGIFVLADNGVDNICIWCRCAESVSYDDFGGWASDDRYPVSHWMYLPEPPEEMTISDDLRQLSAAINYLSQKRKDILDNLKAHPEKKEWFKTERQCAVG